MSSIFVWVFPILELRTLELHNFSHFSSMCFDTLSCSFAYDFSIPYYDSSSSVVNLYQCLEEIFPYWNLEYWKYTVFRIVLLHVHPSTYWAEMLHRILFHCTTDQVWVSSIVSVLVGVMPNELKILEIHSFPHFSPSFYDILSWHFVSLNENQIKLECRQFM